MCNFAEELKWTVLIIFCVFRKLDNTSVKYSTQRDVGCQKQSGLEHFFRVGGIPGQAYRFTDVNGGNVTDNILQLQNMKGVLSMIYHETVIRGIRLLPTTSVVTCPRWRTNVKQRSLLPWFTVLHNHWLHDKHLLPEVLMEVPIAAQ